MMGTSASAEDRRQLPRRPFQATVELAVGEETEGYEADAVDLSMGGMALRTAFLPDVGSELECRFALEGGQSIAARAEVMWAQDQGADAGAFGLRFTDLAGPHEHAIRKSFLLDAMVLDEAPKAGADTSARARLFLPGMEAPLRTRVRTSMDDALVLGSELSFLKLGEPVEVERDGERVPAAIEDVSVEVDPHTRVACLVLTLALATRAVRVPARAAAIVPPASEADAMPIVPPLAHPPSLSARPTRRPAQATAVLASSDEHPALAASNVAADPAGAHPVMEMATADVLASDPGARRAPPAWLVAILAQVRTALRSLLALAGPGARRGARSVASLGGRALGAARTRLRRSESSDFAPDARRAGGVVLRKQHIDDASPATGASTSTPPKSPWFLRTRYGLYGLAAAGTVAIVAALATGRHEPHARVPHPTVAVAPTAPADEAPPAAADTAANAAAPTPTGDTAMGEAAEPMTPEPGAVRDPRRMPSDLVAASRSRSAAIEDAPTLRFARANAAARAATARSSASPAARASAAAPVRPSAAPAPAAPVVAAATTRVVGNPSVHTGTTLRLRMDGPIAGLSGSTEGNTITLHLAGRRSLDLAAPLVHQDARLINAGVYNHGGNADLTLRFRGAVPAFAARGRNDTLEIVLSPAAVATAPAHHIAGSIIASARRRGR